MSINPERCYHQKLKPSFINPCSKLDLIKLHIIISPTHEWIDNNCISEIKLFCILCPTLRCKSTAIMMSSSSFDTETHCDGNLIFVDNTIANDTIFRPNLMLVLSRNDSLLMCTMPSAGHTRMAKKEGKSFLIGFGRRALQRYAPENNYLAIWYNNRANTMKWRKLKLERASGLC